MKFFFKSVNFFFYYLVCKEFSKNIFGRISFLLIAGSISTLNTSINELIVNGVLGYYSGQTEISKDTPLPFFILLILGLICAYISYVASNKKAAELIFEKKILGGFASNKSRIFCYLGSVTEITDIDVIVTSENTNLDLASVSSTSVSGRVRKMASSKNSLGDIVKDHLFDFINDWKIKQNKLYNFNLGTCVFSPPFEMSKVGVKSIVNAVAVKKNEQNQYLLSYESIKKIINSVIEHCAKNNYTSVFIPVFGLGSGGVKPEDSIDLCVRSICKSLENNVSIDVYIGVYRVSDSSHVLKSISKYY